MLNDGKTGVFYTCPAQASEADDSPEAVTYYLTHFEATKPNPWIWIFDCKGMKVRDLIKSGVGKKLAETVQKTYFDTLLGIYIVQPNWAMKALITFLKPFLRKETFARIHMCSLGLIDTVNTLERAGLPKYELSSLTKKLTTDF
jgi:hypothetical protein